MVLSFSLTFNSPSQASSSHEPFVLCLIRFGANSTKLAGSLGHTHRELCSPNAPLDSERGKSSKHVSGVAARLFILPLSLSLHSYFFLCIFSGVLITQLHPSGTH